jgi:peptide/nickel transport system substrate-binding protein
MGRISTMNIREFIMSKQLMTAIVAAFAVGAFGATPATAQKSKDTINIATQQFFSALDYYHDPSIETLLFARNVYGWLMAYDEYKGKFVPELAKSWKRINPTTLEFELRDDVTFSNGNKFTADDVKATLDYLKNPKVRIRFKSRYNWIKEVEKLGPYKVRIIGKKINSSDLYTIAYRYHFFDHTIFNKLENKSDYGRVSAVGTSVYKALSVDRNKGFLVERRDETAKMFPHRLANIKRVQTVPIIDRQAQTAALMTGTVHAIRNPSIDQAKIFATNPQTAVTYIRAKQLLYLTMDAAGRSKNKIFTDKRVRLAVAKAIPREAIIKNFVPGAEIAERPNGICFKQNVSCGSTTKVTAYDPAGAKRLLAEAGYPNGFDFLMTVNGNYAEVGKAVAGELRKVGIRAKIEFPPPSTAKKRRGRGELTTYLALYPTFTEPSTKNIMNFFLSRSRNYNGDASLKELWKQASVEPDIYKRTQIHTKLVDRINEEMYIYPISEMPTTWAHTSKVKIARDPVSFAMVAVGDWTWK